MALLGCAVQVGIAERVFVTLCPWLAVFGIAWTALLLVLVVVLLLRVLHVACCSTALPGDALVLLPLAADREHAQGARGTFTPICAASHLSCLLTAHSLTPAPLPPCPQGPPERGELPGVGPWCRLAPRGRPV
jgi:hypothetical protein